MNSHSESLIRWQNDWLSEPPLTPVTGSAQSTYGDAGWPLLVSREGGGAATCHLANPIRAHFYASGEVRKVSWLTVERDLVLVSTLHLQILCWKMKGELADELRVSIDTTPATN